MTKPRRVHAAGLRASDARAASLVPLWDIGDTMRPASDSRLFRDVATRRQHPVNACRINELHHSVVSSSAVTHLA